MLAPKRPRRKLKLDTVPKVIARGRLKIRKHLKNQKFENRMKVIVECSITHLYNNVGHIWSEDINAIVKDASDKTKSMTLTNADL